MPLAVGRCEQGSTTVAPGAGNASEARFAPHIRSTAHLQREPQPAKHAVQQPDLKRDAFASLWAQAEIGHEPPLSLADKRAATADPAA
jgi:hypothetical protein